MTKTIYRMVDDRGENLLWGRDHFDSYREAMDWAWMKRDEYRLVNISWHLTLTDVPSVWVWMYVFEVMK